MIFCADMPLRKALLLSVVPWILAISSLHAWLNLDLFRKRTQTTAPFRVGFIPVT